MRHYPLGHSAQGALFIFGRSRKDKEASFSRCRSGHSPLNDRSKQKTGLRRENVTISNKKVDFAILAILDEKRSFGRIWSIFFSKMRIELAEMSNLFAVFIKCCGKKSYMERGNRWTISPYKAILPRITGKSFVCFDSIFFVWGVILWGFSCTFLLELWTMPFFGKRFELKNKKIPHLWQSDHDRENKRYVSGMKEIALSIRLSFRRKWEING